ncbi:ATPase with role in protein import into the ER [Kalmusia sp. IMI 367209]|nr:ATPase with role in protein import into the ER [Kalmusia sp. IMI 367209]
MAQTCATPSSLNILIVFLASISSVLFFATSARADAIDVSPEPEGPAPVIGIDFGRFIHAPRILTDAYGERSIPSYIALTPEGSLVGKAARDHLKVQPDQVVSDFRRLLGRKFEDVEDGMENYLCEVIDEEGVPKFRIRLKEGNADFSAEQVVGMFLMGVKEFAERALGQKVSDAVMAVPVHFDDNQKERLKEAAKVADLKILRTTKAPILAAVAYGFGRANEERDGRNILVHDVGGQNHDVTILTEEESVFDVVANVHTRGSVGARFTIELMSALIGQNDEEEFLKLYEDPKAFTQFEAVLEEAKHKLLDSVSEEVNVHIPGLEGTIASVDYEEGIMSTFDPTALIEKALKKANLTKTGIHDIIFIGGSSRIAILRSASESFFDKSPVFSFTVDPAEAVAIGAATIGDIFLEESHGGCFFSIFQSGIGVETVKEDAIIVKRGAPAPTSKMQVFTTVFDEQTEVIIKLYELRFVAEAGDEDLVEKGIIGVLYLTELPAAPAGTVQIQVVIDIDHNYKLHAKATHIESGKSVSLKFENGPPLKNLPEHEIPKEGGEIALLEVPIWHDEL